MRASCRSTLTHRQPSPAVVELMTLAVPTFNQGVAGSIPARPTNEINSLRRFRVSADRVVSALCQQIPPGPTTRGRPAGPSEACGREQAS